MKKTNFGSLSVLQFDIFRKNKNLLHCVTTKEGWKADGLPRFSETQENHKVFRKDLAKALEISPEQFCFPKQTHSDSIKVISEPVSNGELENTDALITNQPGCCLAVQTADCVPVLLHDPVKNVIAAVHAGWRGTVSKIVQKTVQKMQDEFSCSPENILAGIGPAINRHAYEIGKDVYDQVMESFENYEALIQPSMKDGKAYFDLWKANKTLLTDSGIHEENIELMGLCTYELNDLFFSARRDGAGTGRNVSLIMLR